MSGPSTRLHVILLLLALLAGCTSRLPQAASQGGSDGSAATQDRPDAASEAVAGATTATDVATDAAAVTWRVDEQRSALRLYVYRGGALARLGHNHVVVAPLRGVVMIAGDTVTGLDLVTEPADWRIDEPAERTRAGAGFESLPDAAAIAGTRTNMLSAGLLDADRHPLVGIRGRSGPRDGPQDGPRDEAVLPLMLELQLQGRTVPLPVALRVEATEPGWRGHARIRVTHAQLGLTPFSALGGALKVEEGIDIDVEIALQR